MIKQPKQTNNQISITLLDMLSDLDKLISEQPARKTIQSAEIWAFQKKATAQLQELYKHIENLLNNNNYNLL